MRWIRLALQDRDAANLADVLDNLGVACKRVGSCGAERVYLLALELLTQQASKREMDDGYQ